MKQISIVILWLVLAVPCRPAAIDINDNIGYRYVNPVTFEKPSPAASGQYVPNELIIKFRKNIADTIEEQLDIRNSSHKLAISHRLDKLNKKFRARKIKPLFKNFSTNLQRLKNLQKKPGQLLTQKEKRILRRLRRAPKNAKIPALNRIYKLEVEPEKGQSLQEVIAAYNEDPDVEYAELNYIVSTNLTPNDPLYLLQWPLNNTGQDYPVSRTKNSSGTPDCDVNAPEAWDIHTSSPQVVVAVVDTGVDYNHRDLQGNIWVNIDEIPDNHLDDDLNGYIDDIYGYDFINDDNDPIDDNAHGTHCAGIIAAAGDNGLDITGICWNAKIMALKFLNPLGYGNIEDAVAALYYAVENGADVTSNSWSGGGYSETMEEVINYAHAQGVITVAAAGNDGIDSPVYPAFYEHAIAVAATDSNNQKAYFSNYGDWVDIAAPGFYILSLKANKTSNGTPYNDYTIIGSGTSMACPHVAGACALMLPIYPGIKVNTLKHVLFHSTDPISPEICISGKLNLYKAISGLSKKIVLLDSDIYSCSAIVQILTRNLDFTGAGTQYVTVISDGGDLETIVLTEESSSLGIFTGTIATDSADPVIEDGILQTSHGQVITAVYEYANGISAVVTDFADVDCQPPVISNVQIEVPGPEPTVTFQTDEPTTARVLCALACGGPYFIDQSNSNLATEHTIKLIGVSPSTDYYFVIEANDIVDNKTIDSNNGNCYTLTTSPFDNIYVPTQCPTIQKAIDYSWDGTTVWVADEIYTGTGNRDIHFKGKSITVKSINGPGNCIIDCNGSETDKHRGFNFHNNEGPNSVLDGFTIINGYGPEEYIGHNTRSVGGAIFCSGTSPKIINCIIKNNHAAYYGAGIFCRNSNLTVKNSVISENLLINKPFWPNGGGIYSLDSNLTIANSIISGNTAPGASGGIYSNNLGAAITNCTITNCTITGNASALNTGAISNVRGNLTIKNSIIRDNSPRQIASHYGGIASVTYSNIQDGWEGPTNIDTDPCFIDPGYWADINDVNIIVEPNDPNAIWIDGDYYLLPDSPCINTGDPCYVPQPNETDLDGNPRIIGSRVDMGAYEANYIKVPMHFTPRKLNPKSKGKWVKAHFILPEGFTAGDVNTNSPARIIEPFTAKSVYMDVFEDGLVKIMAAFDRAVFCSNGSMLEDIVVIAQLTTGQYFYGTDTIRIKTNNLEYLAVLTSHWLRTDCKKPHWCEDSDINQDGTVDFIDFAFFDGCCLEFIQN